MVDRYNGNNRGGCKGAFGSSRGTDGRSGSCGCSRNTVSSQNNCGCARNSATTQNTCGCSDRGECGKLLRKLQTVDFSLVDTVLYLDAYPDNCEALKYYHKLKAEHDSLTEALAKNCNMPITNFDNCNADSWVWTDSLWPWELMAN